MYLKTLALLLPTLFLTSSVVAQEVAVASSAVPNVPFSGQDLFIFCSAGDCSGTCESVLTSTVRGKTSTAAPNNMGYQSIYWYDPTNDPLILYTCVDYFNCGNVAIAPNSCYNLYDNGVLTDYTLYWWVTNGSY